MSQSQILAIPTGYINNVNNSVPGVLSTPAWPPSLGMPGMLGKRLNLDASQIKFDPAIGTVYGGWFRAVTLKANSAVPVIGQALFWDDTVAEGLYQVTALETITTYGAAAFAGVCLSAGVTPGYQTIIQDEGLVKVKYRAAISGTKATGRPVVLAAAGAGADNGFFDIDDTPSPEYLVGMAVALPVDGALGEIDLRMLNPRG
jgi:hypothetical protein